MGEFFLFIYFVIFQINLGNTLRENRGQPIEVESAEKTKKQKKKKIQKQTTTKEGNRAKLVGYVGATTQQSSRTWKLFPGPIFFGTVFRFLFFIETKDATEVKIPWR